MPLRADKMRLSNYLSFSQYNCFNSGQYEKVYLEGIKTFNKYVELGKQVAENLEAGIETYGLPIPTEREKKLEVDFHGVPLLGYLDGFTEKDLIIDEYKTGTTKWTKGKVNKHEQLTFYAIMVAIKYQVPVEDIKIRLWWLETFVDTDDQVKLTGKKEMTETKRTEQDILIIKPKIKSAWEGIGELVKEWANKQFIN